VIEGSGEEGSEWPTPSLRGINSSWKEEEEEKQKICKISLKVVNNYVWQKSSSMIA